MKYIWGVAFFVLVLFVGCFESNNIGKVKNGEFDFDKSMTVGKAFDRYKYFESVDWREVQIEDIGKVVQFEGIFNNNYFEENSLILNNYQFVKLFVQFRLKGGRFQIYDIWNEYKKHNKDKAISNLWRHSDAILQDLYKNKPVVNIANISLVRDGVLEFDTSTTIGSALDNYKYFKNISWGEFSTHNGRQIIEFTAGSNDIYLKEMGLQNSYDFIRFIIQFEILENNGFEVSYIGSEYKKPNQEAEEINTGRNLDNFLRNLYKNSGYAMHQVNFF